MKQLRLYAPAVLVALALLLGLVASGGVFYEGCLVPLLLLALCLFFRPSTPMCIELPVLIVCVNCLLASLARSAVGMQDSFHETFKLLLLLSAFCAARAVKQKDFVCVLLFSTSVLTAVFGLLAYGGLLPLSEFVLSDGGVLRLQSFFKYSNTTACFLGCGYCAAAALLEKAEKTKYARLFAVGTGTVLLALYLTASKAAIPLFWVIGTIAWRKNDARLTFFIRQNFRILPFAALTLFWGTRGQSPLLYLPIFAAVLLGAFAKSAPQKRRGLLTAHLIFTCTAAVGAIAFLCIKPSLAATAVQRVNYSLDALPLLFKRPLFGCGAGAWRYLQYSVRSQAYNVGYLHNGPLELAIENGQILFWLLVGGLYVCAARAICEKDTELLPIVALLVLHSFFDIDLSFGCMMIVCGLCVGSLAIPTEEVVPPARRFKVVMIFLLGAVMLLFSFLGFWEKTLTARFENVYRSGSREQALTAAQKLESAFPRFAEPVYYEASLLHSVGASDEEVTRLLEKATVLAPYDSSKYEAYMAYAVTAENLDALCEEYIRRAPKRRETYDYIRDFLYYAEQNGALPSERLTEKQKHYHELYRAAYGITASEIYLQNGQYTEFVFVTVVDGADYIPLRQTLEVYGWVLSYDPDEMRIDATKDGESLRLYIGQSKALRNGEPFTLAHGVVNRDGTALIEIEDFERLTDITLSY